MNVLAFCCQCRALGLYFAANSALLRPPFAGLSLNLSLYWLASVLVKVLLGLTGAAVMLAVRVGTFVTGTSIDNGRERNV